MNGLTLSYVAKAMNVSYSGVDAAINSVQTDSRFVSPGDLFVAIVGAKVDGHHYVDEAKARGAVGIVVSRPIQTELPTLQVSDPVYSLGILAKTYRQQFNIPIIALTGSCGKTSVKEMITSILSEDYAVLATKGNQNTEIGVPLTLLRLQPEHQVAVVEMGARKKGDIAYLMSLVSPSITLITNAGVAHLEIFGSEFGIAKAKGEIFSELKPTGAAIINLDDKHADYWQGLISVEQKVVTFGISHQAKIMAKNIVLNPNFSQYDCETDIGSISIQLPVAGLHNVMNALAATAVARAFGLSLASIKKGLEKFSTITGRLQIKSGVNGARIIDDTYNANPISMRAALAVLSKYPGPKIFVMGDMVELGANTVELHRQIGHEAKLLGIQQLHGTGNLTKGAVESFGRGAVHYASKAELLSAIQSELKQNVTILVKGSRGMKMEEVVSGLITSEQEANLC